MCRAASCSADKANATAAAFCDSTGSCPASVTNGCPLEQSCKSPGQCSCDGATLSCGGCGSWNFENGTDRERWVVPQPGGSAPNHGTLALVDESGKNSHKGAGSLALEFTGKSGNVTNAWAQVMVCQGGQTLNGGSYSASVQVFLKTDAAGTNNAVGIGLSNGSTGAIVGTRIMPNRWNAVSTSLSGQQGTNLIVLYVGDALSGTLYIDEVTLTGP